jgi:hypothetical protein
MEYNSMYKSFDLNVSNEINVNRLALKSSSYFAEADADADADISMAR